MFDLTSSKLLLLAVVALLVIGPKDFPVLLRTIGKYVGIIRGHAKEFRAQFDEAMRESELSQLKKDMESIGKETEASLTATKDSVEQTFAEARHSVEASVDVTKDAPPGAATEPLPSTPVVVTADTEAPAALPEAAPEPAAGAPPAADSPKPAPQIAAAAPAVDRTGA
jgi:sec-independent protein translocase protein TatB